MDYSEELNIGNICNGAVPEVFTHELEQIIKNINDPNTPPEAKRSLVIKFDFKPMHDRSSAEVTMSVKSTTAAVQAVKSSVYMSKISGTLRAYANDPRQTEMFNTKGPKQ